MKDKRKNIESELSEIAPFLANLKKDNTPLEKFEIPSDYFNQLSDSIFEKTILESETAISTTTIATTKQTIWERVGEYFQWLLRPGVAVIATSVVIVAGVGVYLMNQPSENQSIDLTAAEIEQYVEENIDIFEDEQLADLITITENTSTISIPIDNIEVEDLEEYIESNYIEDITIDELL